ncbi:hypothetical protein FA15DRAFT_294438 [Coprinopsis marcescibilis]|uniref:Uncharacterized protein n=1 Tax=Coprinopsis marcescibilis TaxID=230819 RepID=A0A5C3L2K7_COPMA|nr:hypothetical protein FA15DRAFT_294438 [Coprinopsis marcescibilis]
MSSTPLPVNQGMTQRQSKTTSSPSSSSLPPPSPLFDHTQSQKQRRNSLRLPINPPEIPIPPSLLHSPYLHANRFHRDDVPHLPSEEDEMWLQDTVPLGARSNPPSGLLNSAPCTAPPYPASTSYRQPSTPPLRPSTATGAQGFGLEYHPGPHSPGISDLIHSTKSLSINGPSTPPGLSAIQRQHWRRSACGRTTPGSRLGPSTRSGSQIANTISGLPPASSGSYFVDLHSM